MTALTKTLILGFLFFEIASFSQSFNDTIFTKTSDTIICQITLVNDHNIFYQYKKKRKIKAADISRDQVFSYSSINPKIVEIIDRPVYPKCDTCENFLVLNSQDTIFLNLHLTYINEAPEGYQPIYYHNIIEKVQILKTSSSTKIELKDIKYIKWDQLEYSGISLDTETMKSLHSVSNTLHIYGESFLTHQLVKGERPLYALSFKRGDHVPVPIPPFSAIIKKVTYRYFTVIDGKMVFIPKGELKLREFLLNYFNSEPIVIDFLRNKTIHYFEVVSVFELANSK